MRDTQLTHTQKEVASLTHYGSATMRGKKRVDVENLLFWTYALQRADIASNVALNDAEAAVAGVPRREVRAEGGAAGGRQGGPGNPVGAVAGGDAAPPRNAGRRHDGRERVS